jgi:transposase
VKNVILVVGIDISKDDFHVCAKEKTADGNVKVKGSRSFKNNTNGFAELALWVSKREKAGSLVRYIMEATGSYYEDLAYYLYEAGNKVSVVLANKIKHFAKSLNVKTKTDKVDSAIIAEIGVERELQQWKPMSPKYKELRDLCREMLSLKKEKSRAMCQLHAMNHSHDKTPSVVKIKKIQIDFYKDTILEIEAEIERLVNADTDLKNRIDKIQKVKGLKLNTIIVVLCETNGFQMFESIRQVVSYAGFDVVMKESGNFKGKTKISKKGNSRIRQCLFMPAMSAIQHNAKIKDLYSRIVERNPDIKRKGVVAGMRKLLILIFVLWKKNEEYDPNYVW